jgi:hypothetical protein
VSQTEPQHNGKPALAGYVQQHTQGTSLRVWCRWCCRWHTHGLADSHVGHFTHRSADCTALDSPYKDGGYYVLVTDTPFSVIRPAMKAATTAQQAAISTGRISAAVQRLRDQPIPAG